MIFFYFFNEGTRRREIVLHLRARAGERGSIETEGKRRNLLAIRDRWWKGPRRGKINNENGPTRVCLCVRVCVYLCEKGEERRRESVRERENKVKDGIRNTNGVEYIPEAGTVHALFFT